MTAEKPPLSNQGETSREAVTDRLARLDDYGKLELFSTCHNCAKWQEVLFADNEHCIKPKVAKSPPSRHPFRPGGRSVQLRDSDRSDVLMQGMISIEDNSKAAVGLIGALLQLSYIEQCILLDHIEEGMTFEDLVASLKSSASHEAKSIAKRIEALSEELDGYGEQDMANDEGRKMIDDDKRRETARRLRAAAEQADPAVGVSELEIFCILDVDMGGERGFADMQDVLRLADLIDRPARQGSEKGDER